MEISKPKITDHINGTLCTGVWSSEKIPVYTILNADGLNQFVGYVKHINATNGTVLYRGQCSLYPSVIPSICRDKIKLDDNKAKLDNVLEEMVKDEVVKKTWVLGENGDISDWKEYQKLILEATLQHYGASTFCVDFVDNHWTALWFGLYRWDKENGKYIKRDPMVKQENEDCHIEQDQSTSSSFLKGSEPKWVSIDTLSEKDVNRAKKQAEDSERKIECFLEEAVKSTNNRLMKKWVRECRDNGYNPLMKPCFQEQYLEGEQQGHLYLFLYVADTNAPTVRGISLGSETYVLDLRKTIPSTFLRPCAQHGWIVKGIRKEHYSYEKRIACVLRISVGLVSQMLGNGILTSENNFFPSYKNDNGYDILLKMQKGTKKGNNSRKPKILPKDTIPVFD